MPVAMTALRFHEWSNGLLDGAENAVAGGVGDVDADAVAEFQERGFGFTVAQFLRWDLATREQAKTHVFEYIEVDYNRTRFHSTLGHLSPEQSELTHVD